MEKQLHLGFWCLLDSAARIFIHLLNINFSVRCCFFRFFFFFYTHTDIIGVWFCCLYICIIFFFRQVSFQHIDLFVGRAFSLCHLLCVCQLNKPQLTNQPSQQTNLPASHPNSQPGSQLASLFETTFRQPFSTNTNNNQPNKLYSRQFSYCLQALSCLT